MDSMIFSLTSVAISSIWIYSMHSGGNVCRSIFTQIIITKPHPEKQKLDKDKSIFQCF